MYGVDVCVYTCIRISICTCELPLTCDKSILSREAIRVQMRVAHMTYTCHGVAYGMAYGIAVDTNCGTLLHDILHKLCDNMAGSIWHGLSIHAPCDLSTQEIVLRLQFSRPLAAAAAARKTPHAAGPPVKGSSQGIPRRSPDKQKSYENA